MWDPYFLPTLIVHRVIEQRYRQNSFDVWDAVFLCHLCCVVALMWARPALVKLTPHKIRLHWVEYSYISPGQLFGLALGAALEYFTRPGYAVVSYFTLLEKTVRAIGGVPFETVVERTSQLVRGYATETEFSQGSYEHCVATRWADIQSGLERLRRAYRARDLLEFVLAPIVVLTDRVVSAPLLVRPESISGLWEEASPAQFRSMVYSLLTRKLWSGQDLTCLEMEDQPLHGSVIGCSHERRCLAARASDSSAMGCRRREWRQFLNEYGLTAEVLERCMRTANQ